MAAPATPSTGHPQLVDLLREFGLVRNPFNDRTAEKTGPLDDISLFVPSDLRNFSPSPTTYVFFGKRGSGKTTIRLMMQRAYEEENNLARQNNGKGFFIVDLSCPAHLTARLRSFQSSMGGNMDTWDTVFSESWTTSDFVDCILSVVATQLVLEMSDQSNSDLIERLLSASNSRLVRYFLLLIHLYADVDAKTLAKVRSAVNARRQIFTTPQIAGGMLLAGGACATALVAARHGEIKYDERVLDDVLDVLETLSLPIPAVMTSHPRVTVGLAAAAGITAAWYTQRCRRLQAYERAAKVKEPIRVVKGAPVSQIAGLLNATFDRKDGAETVRAVCIGISPFQKLDNVSTLLRTLGFESLVVFGDCFDEVSLLDPVVYPSAVKTFAREACRNDVLNFGRMHLFFPETRLALDLSTDKTLKEARFDRHFVRDLVWSRFQLEELAKRRFLAAQYQMHDADFQHHDGATHLRGGGGTVARSLTSLPSLPTFNDIFKKVKTEDLSSYLSKLSTPRELMIMMSEIFTRIESNPAGGVTAQDLEIATQKALEQTV